VIVLEKVVKIYNQGQANEVAALTDVSLAVAKGSMVCLRGASGSGKSTLLAIMGCVLPPTCGKAAVGGKQLARLPDRFLTIYRRQLIGFVFQHFNLLPALTVRANIVLPLLPLGIPPKEQERRAAELLVRFGIEHRRNFPVGQISGGELQRVAIARALINDPPIILADEPTAHLDSRLSIELMGIMAGLKQAGKTVILTSHDSLVADHPAVDRIIDIRDGRIAEP